MEWRGTGSKRALKSIKDTFVYIPILETLESFLNLGGALEEVTVTDSGQITYFYTRVE